MNQLPLRQKGAALVISLMFLLVLTIIGIASVSTTSLQERMANNTREQNLAFMAAEAALRDGEAWLFNLKGTGTPPITINTCSSSCGTNVGIWSANSSKLTSIADRTQSWWEDNGREHGMNLAGTDSRDISTVLHDAQPRYVIQRYEGTAGAAGGSLGEGFGPQSEDLGPFLYRVYGYGVGRVSYQSNGQTRHFDALVESIFRISQF